MSLLRLPLEQAVAGMCLATDIRDAGGAVLLAAGSQLNDALLAALRRRGVGQIGVLDTQPLSEEDQEARRDAVRVRLAHLFRRAGAEQADCLLFEAMLDYRLEQLP